MSSIPLHYVDLRAFVYATEVEARVEAALRRLLPEEFGIDRETTEGHYGDPITVLSARVENADDLRVLLGRLGELPPRDRQRLREELDDRVDENVSLYVSLDKQAAYDGTIRLGDGITLRGKVEAYPAKRPKAVAAAEELLEGL